MHNRDGYGTIFVTFGIENMSSERFRAIQESDQIKILFIFL